MLLISPRHRNFEALKFQCNKCEDRLDIATTRIHEVKVLGTDIINRNSTLDFNFANDFRPWLRHFELTCGKSWLYCFFWYKIRCSVQADGWIIC